MTNISTVRNTQKKWTHRDDGEEVQYGVLYYGLFETDTFHGDDQPFVEQFLFEKVDPASHLGRERQVILVFDNEPEPLGEEYTLMSWRQVREKE